MLFVPLPGSYAVVEIDVEKTLEPLNDPLASAAGALIKTTKCGVYLDMVLRLPLPHDAHFKYMTCLVGPGLRPAHSELCIAPDMCVPILPNTRHPSADREALRSDPPFPFGNCFHWFGPDMWLDVWIVNDGWDYSVGPCTTLPLDEHVKMVGIQDRDIWRSSCARRNLRCVEADEYALGEPCSSPRAFCGGPCCRSDDDFEHSDEDSPRSSVFLSSEGSCDRPDALDDMDLRAHFKGDADVPDPMEFMRQRDALLRIIEESKARVGNAHEAAESDVVVARSFEMNQVAIGDVHSRLALQHIQTADLL